MQANPRSDATLADAEGWLRHGEDDRAIEWLLAHLDQRECAVCLREWALAERRLDLLPPVLDRLERDGDEEAEVSRAIRRQTEGDPAGALELLKPVLGAHPEAASAHHHAGRALHNLGRRAQALAALRVAVQLRPDYAEAWYSLAHALRAAGRMDEAIGAYRSALARHSGFRAALLNLAITLVAVERADEALAVLDRLLALHPDDIEGWINKGLCLHVLGRLQEAEDCYREALQRDPAHPQAHFYFGCLLNERLDSEAARTHLEAALQATPDDPDVLTELAGLMEQLNHVDAARRHVARGLASAPGHPGLVLEGARLARRAADLAAARTALLSLDASALPQRVAQQYWFERGLVHDRGGEPDAAFEALQRAHAIAAASPRRRGIDRDAFPRHLQGIAEWLQRGAPGARRMPTDPVAAPAFVPAFLVGFPRSGSTLLDTMLDAHPEVASIEERPTLEGVAEALLADGSGYPEAMERLEPGDVAGAQARYLAAAGSLVRPGARVVLDKLPLRLLAVPLIHRLFPDAPILFAERHPCDVVLSNLMQQYRPNEAFVHFDTLADAAQTYDRVMRLWRSMVDALPLRLHRVRYERLVREPHIELPAACAALGIDFDPAMLDPARRLGGRGRIATNSYQQVAEPLYQRAAGRWQQYRRWLEPVLPLLQPHIDWLGYGEQPAEPTDALPSPFARGGVLDGF